VSGELSEDDPMSTLNDIPALDKAEDDEESALRTNNNLSSDEEESQSVRQSKRKRVNSKKYSDGSFNSNYSLSIPSV
jgi:hypothetical protein